MAQAQLELALASDFDHDFEISRPYYYEADWKQAMTMRRGYEYNYKLTARQVAPHSGVISCDHSFVSIAPDNLVLTAVKKAEDGNGLISRFYEWAGESGKVQPNVPSGAVSATLTNLMEQPEGAPLAVR